MTRSPPGALVYQMTKSNSEEMLIIFVFHVFAGISLAAGEGFEPSLTDPESGSVCSRRLLIVSKTVREAVFADEVFPEVQGYFCWVGVLIGVVAAKPALCSLIALAPGNRRPLPPRRQ